MAVAVARHLVKVDPGNPGAWINSLIQFGAPSVSSKRKQFFSKRVCCIPAFQDCDRPSILIKTFGAWDSTAMTPMVRKPASVQIP